MKKAVGLVPSSALVVDAPPEEAQASQGRAEQADVARPAREEAMGKLSGEVKRRGIARSGARARKGCSAC